MKKTFTLLVLSILISAATFAQGNHRGWNNDNNRGRDNNRSYAFQPNHDGRNNDAYHGDHGRDRNWGGRDDHREGFGILRSIVSQVRIRPVVTFTYHNYNYDISQRDAVIGQVSAYYDNQIQQVMNDCYMSEWQKRDAISNLQAQKAQEINGIYDQCGDGSQYQGQY